MINFLEVGGLKNGGEKDDEILGIRDAQRPCRECPEAQQQYIGGPKLNVKNQTDVA